MTKKIGEMRGSLPIEVFKPHWFILAQPLFFTLLSSSTIFGLYYFYRNFLYSDFPLKPGYIFFVSGFFFILALSPIVNAIFYRETTQFGVYSDRVTFRTGFISRSVSTVPLSELTSIDLDQGIIGRLLNYGKVSLEARGSDGISVNYLYRASHLVEMAIDQRNMMFNHLPRHRSSSEERDSSQCNISINGKAKGSENV